MSDKLTPSKPFLLLLYGYPGSGKTLFARQLAEELGNTVHLNADRLEHDLKQEMSSGGQYSSTVFKTVQKYMAQEYLNSGISVILDTPVIKKSERRMFRNLALANKAATVLVWIQIDPESSFNRTKKRDRRKTEDKYASDYTPEEYQNILSSSQNPDNEDFVVISGKHTYKSQRVAVLKKLYEIGIIKFDDSIRNIVKPELVNLIPKFHKRGDILRRNISIR
jgi:predicted kinase